MTEASEARRRYAAASGEPVRLSHHASLLADKLRDGRTLRAQADPTEEGIAAGGRMFWIDPPGKKCGPKSARELIDKGFVEPLRDALFEGDSQSWRWGSRP